MEIADGSVRAAPVTWKPTVIHLIDINGSWRGGLLWRFVFVLARDAPQSV
jgi:hypothetical protein